jgi:outer membrane protein OmpA-like peptidoglycan-associated protein
MKTARCAAVLLTLLLLLPALAMAQSSPRATLEAFFTRATAMLYDAPDRARAWPDVQRLAAGLFDGEHAARRTLGADWERGSGAERAELSAMLGGVLAHAYLEVAKARLPRDRPPAMLVLAEDVTPEGATVRTLIRARDGSDVRLDYLMARPERRWRVYDVIVDGVSMVDNYRAQFARMARTSSPADAMSALRRLAGLAAAEAATPPAAVVAYFPTGGADLGAAARGDLDRLAASLAGDERMRVVVESHADARGEAGANRALAERRADAVRRYLASHGVDAERIGAVVLGDRRPVCREPVEACWAQNRRVVVRPVPADRDPARAGR